MALIAKDNGDSFELPPTGTHLARCVKIIDLGTQGYEYQGQRRTSHKCLVAWELALEADKQGKPFTVFNRYTLSLGVKAALRHDLEAWRGRAFTEEELAGFHLGKVLGAWCFISITHTNRNGKDYANVNSVMSLPKGTPTPESNTECIFFELDAKTYRQDLFDSFSDGLKKQIQESPEWKEINGLQYSEASDRIEQPDFLTEEDIPF